MTRTALVGVAAIFFLLAAPTTTYADLCEEIARQRKSPEVIKTCQAAQEAEKALELLRRYRSLMTQEMRGENEAVEYHVQHRPPSTYYIKPWEKIPSHPAEVAQDGKWAKWDPVHLRRPGCHWQPGLSHTPMYPSSFTALQQFHGIVD